MEFIRSLEFGYLALSVIVVVMLALTVGPCIKSFIKEDIKDDITDGIDRRDKDREDS